MSDNIEELSKAYRRNVSEEHARSIGLFTIPEYPEFEGERGMWSTALDVILTTLRYLAPASLLTIFWGQQSFLFKLLKYIDSAFRSLVYTCDEQKQTVLQWLENAGTVRVDKLETVWRHGWIVCGVLDIALPGTCAGHPPTKLSLKHAQSIAEDYLGVEPIFTRQELECIDTLGKHQEWKLITFLDNIRLAIAKLTPPPSKPSPIRFAAESTHHTFDYIAKGAGLVAAQINTKAYFKIYPTAQQSLNPGEINIEIKGPKKSHGTYKIPAILGKAQIIRQSLLGRKVTSNYTESILPLTQGTTYLRNFGKNDMSKTYFIPKLKNNIEIETETNEDHIRVGYTVKFEGKYEILITSKNLSIAGSPFLMEASKDIVETLENDSFSLEDGEEIDIVDVSTDKKVVLRIVDFGTEKMLLKEDGCLEKISNDEAKQLMECDSTEDSPNIEDCENLSTDSVKTNPKNTDKKRASKLFYEAVRKIIIMKRVSKYFWCYKKTSSKEITTDMRIRNQDIPDVVNSTLNEYNINADLLPATNDKYIIPEKIAVMLLTEKLNESESRNTDTHKSDDVGNYGPLCENVFDDDVPTDTQNSSNNPFVDETYVQSYSTEKKFGSFNISEYETNNSQSEETQNISTKIVHKECNDERGKSTNPFSEEINLDISSECNAEEKEPLNPFTDKVLIDDTVFENKSLTDFVIGAPVSLLPHLMTTSTDSLNSQNTSSDTASCDKSEVNDDLQESTRVHEEHNSNKTKLSNISPKKDMWDSAYVSIDENNCSDVIVNENIDEAYQKQRLSNTDKIPNTVSIENEILEKFDVKQETMVTECDTNKRLKHESKRLTFTPIEEESDKNEELLSKSNAISEIETDSVAEAFAELDNIYDDYFSNNEVHSNPLNKNIEIDCVDINQTIECDVHVDSASEKAADVKRQTKTPEGKTSKVQANVTESVSASQILLIQGTDIEENNNVNFSDETQFGKKIYTNIVIEKKNYWDEKIRQIQAKADELKSLHKRRLSSKYLRRNDSLTKRRGKKIVKNFLKSNEKEIDAHINSDVIVQKSIDSSLEVSHNKAKLKDSIKNYWDSRVQAIHSMDSCFGKKSEKDKENSRTAHDVTPDIEEIVMGTKENCNLETKLQMKQDLSEKVFEAFETSPKRFFGTSRQNILSKIDTVLGNSGHDDENKSITSEISHDSGLVSSRISLFHNITKTEPLPTSYRKHKSLNNIYTEKVSIDKNFILKEHPKSFNCDNESSSIKIGNVVNIDKNANLIKEPIVSFQVKKLEDSETLKNEKVNVCIGITQDTKNINTDQNIDVTNDTETGRDFDKRHHISITNTEHNNNNLLKSNLNSFSKSEMDIFSKTSTAVDIELDKHKSYEDLPTISVKKFISLYEDVSKSSDQTKSTKSYKKNPKFQGKMRNDSSKEGTAMEPQSQAQVSQDCENKSKIKTKPLVNDNSFKSDNMSGSAGFEIILNDKRNASCLSLSDIEIEIIEQPEDTIETADKTEAEDYTDYKNRFKMAKQYFKSLEELRIEKKPKENKENVLVNDIPEESLEPKVKKEKVKKSNIKKSHSLPSSELSKIWNQMQEDTNNNPKKLIKISEKFNVEDLYEDVMDGRLSRQGSLRGIPNKKAVLETFRSMENVNTKNFNSYEFATSQMTDFANENKIKNAQTYLSEYPYLPTTDPSKYHSRIDASASGLITFKELKELKQKRTFRRNSVPDARINPIFTEDL